jgi:tRNA1Val (adenine37-N6)-methyltransferase
MSDYNIFKLKYFNLFQSEIVFKVGTDAFVLGAWISCNKSPNNILDIGTGTGILSLMMAQKFPNASITAIDSSSESVSLANANFQSNEIGRLCNAMLCTFQEFRQDNKFDLIVSNPPYFLNSLEPKNVSYAQSKHLDSAALEALFCSISRSLKSDGLAALIHPEHSLFDKIASDKKLYLSKQLRVYGVENKLVRLCSVYSQVPSDLIEVEHLILRDSLGKYTESYKELTRHFHGVDL